MATIGEILFWLPFVLTGFFLIFTFLKTISKNLDSLIFCSVCASYFFVMIGLFIIDAPSIIISYSVGLTISGLAYKISYKDSEQRFINFFISMITLTIIGDLIIYYYII